jgi:hypothetical protein
MSVKEYAVEKLQQIKFNKAVQILDRYLEGKEVEKREDDINGVYIVPLALIVNDSVVLDALKQHYKAVLEEMKELNLEKLLEDDKRTKKPHVLLLKKEEVATLKPIISVNVAFSIL